MDENNLVDQMPPTIGRYKVLEGIGFGAMGAVYKAFDPLIKRTLAIKTIRLDIPRQSPQYKSFIERFYHEARISGTLSHPNIVTLFDIGEENGVPYLAMEFVEGDTIASILERGVRFKPEKVVGLVSQIAAALDYAHGKGVIHRDVKPANLMLYEEERIKVTDFGIAKLVDAEMTQSGTLLGTPSYMSPEQAMGDKLDGRSDIFSLGVCAFEMLSGEQPFPGNNVTSILYKLVHVDPIEPANLEMNGLVPQKWHEVFGTVLAKKPEDRYQNAGAFVRDLEYCLGSWFGSLDEASAAAAAPAAAPDADRTATMPRPAAPPPPPAEEDSPATVILKAPAEADAGTVVLKAPPEDSPATVVLKSPVAPPRRPAAPLPPAAEVDSSTVVLRGPVPPPPPPPSESDSPATVVLKAPVKPAGKRPAAAAPPPPEEDSSTVVLKGLPEPGEEPATVMLKAPGAVPSGAPEPTKALPRPPAAKAAPSRAATSSAPGPPPPEAPSPTVKVPATVVVPAGADTLPVPPPTPPRRSGVSPVLLLGGAAAFFLVAAVVVAWLLLRDRFVPPTPEPTPVVVDAPVTPPPVTSPITLPPLVGVIRIATRPPGAAVTVDGETRGASPLELTELAFGTYDVKVELKGYEPRTQKIEVTEAAPLAEVKLALVRPTPVQGTADILSTPFGAAVSIDGSRVGVTPLTQLKLKPGTRKVEMSKDGYERWTGTVAVQAGKRARVDAQLKAVVRATPTPQVRKPEVDTARVYRPGEVDTPPRRRSGLSPSYPSNRAPRLKSGQSVSVVVTWVVNEEGGVEDVRVEQSASKPVDEAVVDAISSWKYEPGVKRGVKVKVRMTLKQTFQSG